MSAEELDQVWKALGDGTRREILAFLREGPRTTSEVVEQFPHLTRFGVMKHIGVLRDANLVLSRSEGPKRMNSLNVVPIRQIYEQLVDRYQDLWAGELLAMKRAAEKGVPVDDS